MAQRDEIGNLTGLRGVAALWVLGYHASIAPAGYLGVDLFFVLSGFIIAYQYAAIGLETDAAAYRDFLWRRLARIYPAYLFALLLTVGCVAVLAPWGIALRDSAHFTPSGLIASALMLQAWTLPVPRIWNVPGWSVSAEWAAYLAFPFIAARVRRIDSPRTALLAILLAYVLLVLAMSTLSLRATLSFGLVRIAAGFTAGVLLHRLWVLRGTPRDGASRTPLLALVLMIAGATLLELQVRKYLAAQLFPVLSCVVIYGLASSRATWLCGAPAQWLGRVSYSLYIVHWPIVQLWRRWAAHAANPPDRPLVTAAAIVSVLLVAGLVYHWVEVFARCAMLAWSTRRRVATAVAAQRC